MTEKVAERPRQLDEIELPEGQYWVVYVTDPGGEVSRIRRRFEFRGESASREAWRCYQQAKHWGFTARAEKVRKV